MAYFRCGGVPTFTGKRLFENGVQYVPFDFEHTWRYNSYSYKDSELEETDIKVYGNSSAGSSVTGTNRVIDITDYNTLVYEVTNNSVPITIEIDISDMSGSYYIGIGFRYTGMELIYGLCSSKNLGTGAVRVQSQTVSSNTTYVNKVYLRK